MLLISDMCRFVVQYHIQTIWLLRRVSRAEGLPSFREGRLPRILIASCLHTPLQVRLIMHMQQRCEQSLTEDLMQAPL